MTRDDFLTCIRAALATQLLHTEARTASLAGHGFYTIGPCGEELLAGVGIALRPTDAVALHYRHVATQIARQLAQGRCAAVVVAVVVVTVAVAVVVVA